MEVDWGRTSGAASIACAVLALVACPGVFVFAALVFGILGLYLSPSRAYTVLSSIGLALALFAGSLLLLRILRIQELMTSPN